ncbi:DUF4032 domain-containing protein [candidate division KSB1 bacterium]|nr:DUF4032 domain-containing protein [candidate division KSB1 bacterium]
MKASPPSYPIFFLVEDHLFLDDLQKLPWQYPIEEWRQLGVKHLNIKAGIGRHPVVFVQVDGRNLVVKQLGFEVSQREVDNYKEMLLRGIHTLIPLGCVMREEEPIAVKTPVGKIYERNLIGHTVTLLIDRVLPDSQLYRRAFKFENRQRIWDAIVDLFVELHLNGVYWGDASLANTLIKFYKVDIPHIGKKTQLKAFLADAETVEIHDSISDSLREADVGFFIESMEWIDEDLRASGIIRDELATEQDKAYVQTQYERRYEVAVKGRAFEKMSALNIDQYLGPVRDPAYFDTLQKHIDEHKWYLSERRKREVPFTAAAQDWLQKVFIPVCELIKKEGVLDFFPGKTASELYVEIMNNKYLLSKEKGKDVGIIHAARDYAKKFGQEPPLAAFWNGIARKVREILRMQP